jgi:putative membrane protein
MGNQNTKTAGLAEMPCLPLQILLNAELSVFERPPMGPVAEDSAQKQKKKAERIIMKTSMIKRSGILAPLALGLGLLAIAQYAPLSARAADAAENPGQISATDYKFVTTAARGGTLEVTLGNLAQKSTQQAVKQFGQRMVDDHGKAGKQLNDLAAQKGAMLPAGISDEQQKEVDRLSLLTGPDFDRAYVAFMVKAHKADLKEVKRAAQDVQDPDIKAFAANMVPTIQEHLSMAQALDENLKSGMPANN